MDENKSCSRCAYWSPVWTLGWGSEEKRSKRGGCHRHAPRSSPLTQSWPITKSDHWCGEFEPRLDERRALKGAGLD